MDSQQWFYARGDTPVGPLTYGELIDVIRSGQCGPEDLVWREGMPDWQAASTVPELFPRQSPHAPGAFTTTPVPPMTPPPPILPAPHAAPGISQLGYGQPVQGNHNGLAIAAFVCSVCGLPLTCCLSVFSGALSIVALCLAIAAKSGMQRTGSDQGRGFATAAIVISIVHLALCAGLVVFYGIVILSHK